MEASSIGCILKITYQKNIINPGLGKRRIVSIADVQYFKDGGSDEYVDFLVKGHSTTKNETQAKHLLIY